MNILTIAILIDLLMSFLVVVYTVNHVRLKKEHEEIYGEEEDQAKEPEADYPEMEIDGGCTVTRRFVESRVYRDSNGVLHRDYPRYRVEVELEEPVDSPLFQPRKMIIKRVEPEIELIGYICDGGKRIIEY